MEIEMIPKEKSVELYETIVRIRFFEEKAVELFLKGLLPGFLHSSLGQEAISAGACSTLREDDYIISTHRGHGDIIAKGARVDRMMAELFGKKTGYCKGKGGSIHIADLDLNILGATGIVGSGLCIINGAALACQMKGTDQVAICFFGDGASNTGAFHEGLNLAAIWNLPVIFICQNNLYAESTPQRVHQKICDVSERGLGYGIRGQCIDGNDVMAVYETTSEAVERARKGLGPTLIECKTYRWLGHYVGDPSTAYRTKGEVEEWKKRDPVKLYRAKLLEMKICSEKDLAEIDQKIEKEIEEAVVFAQSSPEPEVEDALEDIYVGPYIP
ncbi:MAG: thiamine pyrophosphate-dependent dehydrogenase E1 component subunit alpha [Thermodesulfobacteriota bacterium]|jgi:TPP-dependent pyruvate/acetoin dehydrogenase alpha subunit